MKDYNDMAGTIIKSASDRFDPQAPQYQAILLIGILTMLGEIAELLKSTRDIVKENYE